MIIGSLVHLIFAVKGGTSNETVWTLSLTGIVGGFGLIFAGDAGATPPPAPADPQTLTKPDSQNPQQ